MTDTPNRSIGGLAPRGPSGQPDLSRLQRRNRESAASSPRADHATVTPLTSPTSAPQVEPASALTAETAAGLQDRVTVYIDRELRGRARSAYRATAHLEGDRTWSDFVERAVLAEVERREQAHNSGRMYTASNDKLAPGRNVS